MPFSEVSMMFKKIKEQIFYLIVFCNKVFTNFFVEKIIAKVASSQKSK
jgi:hypothetical protein